MVINNYELHFNDDGYLIGFEAVLDDNYEYVGQMSQFPDACRGWTKFVNGEFVEDVTKKEEILAQEEADRIAQEKESQRLEAQITYTALCTSTLLDE